MCSKTKYSYGCGHCAKITEQCDSPGCTEIIKWKNSTMRYQDCDRCKAAGVELQRGKEGRGRHAREIARTRGSRQSSSDSLDALESPSSPGSPCLSISPWVSSDRSPSKEKQWNTPTRQMADDAWVVEHERRMSDLDEKIGKISLSSHRESRRGSRRSSPQNGRERIFHAVEVDEPEEGEPPHSPPRLIKMLPYEFSDHSGKAGRKPRQRSYDGEHSAPHYQQSLLTKTPHRRTQIITPISEHDLHDSDAIVRTPRYIGPKTEPYRPHPQSCYFDSPVSGSPVVDTYWQGRHEFIQPLHRDAYLPRQYPVH